VMEIKHVVKRLFSHINLQSTFYPFIYVIILQKESAKE